MKRLLCWVTGTFWFFFSSEKCELCHGKLRRFGDKYFGGVDIHDSIGRFRVRTAYICILCYELFIKK